MTIYVTGDTHGFRDIKKLNSRSFIKGKNLTKEDYVVICGDFGLLWTTDPKNQVYKEHKFWLEWLTNKQWTTLVVDGNHENMDMFAELEVVNKFGGAVGKYNDSIFHLRRGEIYDIDDKKILTMGGATSVDKEWRLRNEAKYGKTWWEGELWSRDQEDNCFNNLKNSNFKVDYVLSHTAPISVINDMFVSNWAFSQKIEDPVSKLFEFIYKNYKLEFKKWYFGHFHEDKTSGKFTCLFDSIKKLGE